MAEKPIFDPVAFNLTPKQIELTTLARQVAHDKFADRAAIYDREARFPTENYHGLYDAGLMDICIPEAYGGMGRTCLPTQ